MNRHKLWIISFAIVLMGLLAACGSENKQEVGGTGLTEEIGGAQKDAEIKDPEKTLAPVTLKFQQRGTYFTDQDFLVLISDPLKKKYPHITVELAPNRETPEELLARSESFDFLVDFHGNMSRYKELGILTDLTPLAKEYDFDLDRFDSGALNAIRSISDNQELYAAPYAANLNALYYNRDIFDKFAVSYPEDGLTWEEVTEIAKRVTVVENESHYRGLDTDSIQRMLFPLSLNIVEARTNKVLVNSEPYKLAFETAKAFHSIPGNEFDTSVKAVDRFLVDRNLAMLATTNLFPRLIDLPDLNWDVAQFPSYPGRPNLYGMYDLHIVMPMSMSPHKEDQMRVLEVLFSDEVQTLMVRETAKVSVLKDPKYNAMFMEGLPELASKNIAGIFKSSSAPAPEFSILWSSSGALLRDEYESYLRGEKDVNTALRDAEENIKMHVEASLSGK